MIFGIALSTTSGLSGAIYYVAHHIIVQTTLFLVVGLIERQAGSSSLRRLGGLAAASPILAIVFLIPALNLGGIPPFSGFIGKVALLQAGAADASALAWILVAGGTITSLLTLYAVARVWTKAFWRARADAPEGDLADVSPSALIDESEEDIAFVDREDVGKIPLYMLIPTVGLVIVGMALTVFAGRIIDITDRAAKDLQDRSNYIDAVLGNHRPVPVDEAPVAADDPAVAPSTDVPNTEAPNTEEAPR